MALHTREAWRLFVGRPAEAKRRSGAIPGAVRFAAICRSVWVLSAHDNPYADWFLIRAHEELTGVRQHIEQVVTQREVEFDRLRPPMATANSPTCGHPKFPQARRLDYEVSGLMAMRVAASLRR